MKRRSAHLGELVPPVKLYLEDITNIWEAMREACARVVLQTPDYEVSEPGELSKLPTERIRDLEITGFDPYVTLEIRPGSVWLYAAADDITSRGVFQKTKELLLRRQRWAARWLTNPSSALPLIGIVAVAGIWAVPDHWSRLPLSSVPVLTGLVWVAVLVLVGALIAWYQLRGANWVILAPRRQAPNFWQRNRDATIVGVICAIVGAIAGAIAIRYIAQ